MRRRGFLIPALLLALLASADPSWAGLRDGSWWAALDLWFAEPTNVGLDVALEDNLQFNGAGEIVALDLGTEFSGRIRGGWTDSSPMKNSYSISYWSWDGDDSIDESGGFLPVVSDPFFGNFFSESLSSEVDIKATILDLTLSRRLAATRHAAWFWGAGLRHASFDEDWSVTYFDPALPSSLPGRAREIVGIDMKAAGTGLTAGIGGTFRWHPRWRTMLRGQFALLKGETEASYEDTGVIAGLGPQPFVTGIDRGAEDRVFQQIELEAKIIFNVWETLDVSLGYAFLNWSDVVQVDRFSDDIQGGVSFSRDDLAFDGVVVSVSYAFE